MDGAALSHHMKRGSPMKTQVLALAGLTVSMVLTLLLAGCGGSPSAASASPTPSATPVPVSTSTGRSAPAGTEVDFAPASFVQTSVTIHAGQAVHFVDSMQNGGPHLLCLGHDQVCDPHAVGPDMLKLPGIRFKPGDPPTDVVFPTSGTYQITCLLHPLMNLAVTVI